MLGRIVNFINLWLKNLWLSLLKMEYLWIFPSAFYTVIFIIITLLALDKSIWLTCFSVGLKRIPFLFIVCELQLNLFVLFIHSLSYAIPPKSQKNDIFLSPSYFQRTLKIFNLVPEFLHHKWFWQCLEKFLVVTLGILLVFSG